MSSVTAAEHQPSPGGEQAANLGVEPARTWVGDAVGARRFGSPQEIRAALLPEQVPEFDAAFSSALDSARDTLRLDELRQVLLMWRRQALLAERDPEGHRSVLVVAAEIRRTGRPRAGSSSWDTLKAQLGI
jgi:hypothetical protein